MCVCFMCVLVCVCVLCAGVCVVCMCLCMHVFALRIVSTDKILYFINTLIIIIITIDFSPLSSDPASSFPPYRLAHGDLPVSGAQSHDTPTPPPFSQYQPIHSAPGVCQPAGGAVLLEQEWLQKYEEEQETDLKRLVTGTCEGEESTRDWDKEETDLKRQSKGCV